MKPTSVEIIQKLHSAGHKAYWAGGCVRDMLLGTEPKDFDIATSAAPEEMEKILGGVLEKVIPVGKQFGVMIGVKNGHHFEIATFRSDSGYSDGRRPDAVEFTNAYEDAARRDFTINGMFYDPVEDEILDYVGGQKDMEARLIKFIGEPEKRILEDHLRILRAVRLKSQLKFQYHPSTWNALQKHAALLVDTVSNERIGAELSRMIMLSSAHECFEDMEDLGILKVIMPEIQRLKGVAQPAQYHQEGDVWDHTMLALASLAPTASLPVRWATLFHDAGKPDTFELKERIRFDGHVNVGEKVARTVLTRLKFPRKVVDEVCWLVLHHMMMVPLVEMPEGKKRKWFLHPSFLNLMAVFKADAAGTMPSDLSLYNQIDDLYTQTLSAIPRPPKPLITGNDIMKELAIKPGKKVGELLDEAYELQLEGTLKTKQDALKWLGNL